MLIGSSVRGRPCSLVTSEAGEGVRAAWPRSASCLVVCAGLQPTAAGTLNGLCSPVIALPSVFKLMLSLFLMEIK